MLPLSFNTNYDGITVLKQSASRAIILSKTLSCDPRACRVSSLHRSVTLFFFNDYICLYSRTSKIVLVLAYNVM